MTDLSVEVERVPAATLVRLGGDLDKVSAPDLREVLLGLVDEGFVTIIVDTGELVFCDSRGLWVLVELHRKLQEKGGCVRLTGVHGVLKRVLDVTGLKPLFESQL
ncbi:MAG: STAS domain-containing protein [Nonomuraea sp.]|nr:STAS domain-containing protein [Nonomuraea sp.]